MVNHKRNIYSRLVYFALIFIIYRQCFTFFDLSLNLSMYGIFILILFTYYILNVLNFKDKFKHKDFFYSIIVNTVYLGIFYFFYKKSDIFLVFLFYTICQLLISWLLHNHRFEKRNILAIGGYEYCKNIKNVLEKSENYVFKGYVAEEKLENDLDYLGNLSQINNIIKENNIGGIVFSKNQAVKKNSSNLVKIRLRGIKMVDYFSFLEDFEGKIDSDKIDSMWVLMNNGFNNSVDSLNKRIKRTMDLFLAITLFCFRKL